MKRDSLGEYQLKKRNMFLRILTKSLANRRRRIGVAVLAIVLGASLVSALGSVSLEARGKAGRELRSFGANITLLPRATSIRVGTGSLDFGSVDEQGLISETSLEALRTEEIASQVAGYVPYLYGVVEASGQKVILAGTRFEDVRRVSPWWQVSGRWPGDGAASEAIVGSEAARKLGLEGGSVFQVTYEGRTQKLVVAGIVDTGAAEDRQIFVDLRSAQELLDRRGTVGLVQVSAVTERQPVADTAVAIEKTMPGVQATVVGQIAQGESAVLSKVELLMGIVAILVLVASGLATATTMATTVLERTKEIGLLKALGASKAGIAAFFVAEAAAMGVIGGVLGYVVGFAIAQVVGHSVFGSGIGFNPLVFPLSLAVALAVAILASAIPVRNAVEIDPAIILRGE